MDLLGGLLLIGLFVGLHLFMHRGHRGGHGGGHGTGHGMGCCGGGGAKEEGETDGAGSRKPLAAHRRDGGVPSPGEATGQPGAGSGGALG